MKFNLLTRRMFLQGTGGALVSIPFLTSLLPKESWAQAANNPIKRFITIRSAHEMGHHSYWLPNTSGQIFNLVQPTQIQAGVNGHHNVRWQSLRDFGCRSPPPLKRTEQLSPRVLSAILHRRARLQKR